MKVRLSSEEKMLLYLILNDTKESIKKDGNKRNLTYCDKLQFQLTPETVDSNFKLNDVRELHVLVVTAIRFLTNYMEKATAEDKVNAEGNLQIAKILGIKLKEILDKKESSPRLIKAVENALTEKEIEHV